jgi:hypothetical protein
MHAGECTHAQVVHPESFLAARKVLRFEGFPRRAHPRTPIRRVVCCGTLGRAAHMYVQGTCLAAHVRFANPRRLPELNLTQIDPSRGELYSQDVHACLQRH